MKHLIILAFLFGCFSHVLAQSDSTNVETTFILMRHAQKLDDGTKDPQLSDEGKNQAEELSEWLHSNFDISAIYSTDYKRTKLTAGPTAEAEELEIQIYDFQDPVGFLKNLVDNNHGKTILIVGHSNTTPMFANIIMGRKEFESLPENEYNKLFIVKASELGNAHTQIIEFQPHESE